MKILSELHDFLEVCSVVGRTDRPISSIENDSRNCKQDSLFVAIRGTSTDGHTYIDTAIKNGAHTIVCENLPETLQPNTTYILVQNSRTSCAIVSHAFHDNPSLLLRIIGVTGTNGKTTITFLLKQILEQFGEKVGLIGTTGNYIGDKYYATNYTTPEAPELTTLLANMINEGVTTVVMEVSSHSLNMQRVLGVHFSGAIFTNLTHDHLDYHGTMESYADAKKILFDSLSSSSTAVFNGDSAYSSFLASSTSAHKVIVGRSIDSEYRITDEKVTAHGSQFSLNSYTFSTPLVGRFNIDNCAESVAYLVESGYSIIQLQNAVSFAIGAPGRMESYRLVNDATAIIDYAHTPDALENAMKSCKDLLQNSGNLIVVFGCGGDRDVSKRSEMGRIAETYADTIYLTNDNPRSESPEKIIQDIYVGINDHSKVLQIPNRALAIETALCNSKIDDIILIAGKGHETYQIIQSEKRYCSDKDEVMKYMK
ncbi:MAG: UDP-N-acetylmuramoyl-L-alanyl-D-glutamate--2,6-diaminopimelate ligase [Ignavibacteria bacterium]|nr:UDP-N-acetylmuramoyl-L-alanyl-D-glutamate--2,6-diaminopimelate ligase [Ignavibacteria bacterium]